MVFPNGQPRLLECLLSPEVIDPDGETGPLGVVMETEEEAHPKVHLYATEAGNRQKALHEPLYLHGVVDT